MVKNFFFFFFLATRLKVIFNPRTALPQITPYNQNTQTHTQCSNPLADSLNKHQKKPTNTWWFQRHDGLLLILLSLVNTAADRHKQDLQPPHIITCGVLLRSLQHRPSHDHTASVCTTQEAFFCQCVFGWKLAVKTFAGKLLHSTAYTIPSFFLFCNCWSENSFHWTNYSNTP